MGIRKFERAPRVVKTPFERTHARQCHSQVSPRRQLGNGIARLCAQAQRIFHHGHRVRRLTAHPIHVADRTETIGLSPQISSRLANLIRLVRKCDGLVESSNGRIVHARGRKTVREHWQISQLAPERRRFLDHLARVFEISAEAVRMR